MNEAALAIFHRNSRFPDQSNGDMRALMASVELGVKRVGEILDRFGPDVVADAFAQLLARTRRLVRTRLAETFDYGTHRFTDAIDADGHGNGPFKIRFALTREKGSGWRGPLHLRCYGTDDQAPGPVNLPDESGRARHGARPLSTWVAIRPKSAMPADRTPSTRSGCAKARCCTAVSCPARACAVSPPCASSPLSAAWSMLPRAALLRPTQPMSSASCAAISATRQASWNVSCSRTASASAMAHDLTRTASTQSISWRRRTIPSSSSRSAIRCVCAHTGSSAIQAAPVASVAAAGSSGNTKSWQKTPCWPYASTASRIHPGGSTGACPAEQAALSSIPARAASACWRPCLTAIASCAETSFVSRQAVGAAMVTPLIDRRRLFLKTCSGGYVSREAAERLYGVVLDRRPRGRGRHRRARASRPSVRRFHRQEYVDVLA